MATRFRSELVHRCDQTLAALARDRRFRVEGLALRHYEQPDRLPADALQTPGERKAFLLATQLLRGGWA